MAGSHQEKEGSSLRLARRDFKSIGGPSGEKLMDVPHCFELGQKKSHPKSQSLISHSMFFGHKLGVHTRGSYVNVYIQLLQSCSKKNIPTFSYCGRKKSMSHHLSGPWNDAIPWKKTNNNHFSHGFRISQPSTGFRSPAAPQLWKYGL